VSAHVHVRAECREVLRFERLHDARIEMQPLRSLQHRQPAFLARGAQPRADAAQLAAARFSAHASQPG